MQAFSTRAAPGPAVEKPAYLFDDSREEIAEARMKQAAARNIAHEARAGGGDPGPIDACTDEIEYLVDVATVGGKFWVEPAVEHAFGRAIGWRLFDGVEEIEGMAKDAFAELTATICIRLQRTHGLAKLNQSSAHCR